MNVKVLRVDPEKVNPQGGAVARPPARRHRAVLTLTCAYALRRAGKRHGVVTMCIGVGQGIALVLQAA